MDDHQPVYGIIIHRARAGADRVKWVINSPDWIKLLPDTPVHQAGTCPRDHLPHPIIWAAGGRQAPSLNLRVPPDPEPPVRLNNITVLAGSTRKLFPGDLISTAHYLLTVVRCTPDPNTGEYQQQAPLTTSRMALGLLDRLGAPGSRITIIGMDGEQRNRQHPLSEQGQRFTMGMGTTRCHINLPAPGRGPWPPQAVVSLHITRGQGFQDEEQVRITCDTFRTRRKVRLNGAPWRLWGPGERSLSHGDVFTLGPWRFMVNNPWQTCSYLDSPTATYSLPALVIKTREPEDAPPARSPGTSWKKLLHWLNGPQGRLPLTGGRRTRLLLAAALLTGLLSGLTILGILIYGLN